MNKRILFGIVAVLVLTSGVGLIFYNSGGAGDSRTEPSYSENINQPPNSSNNLTDTQKTVVQEFSEFNQKYHFRGQILNAWQVEYVSATDSINIYDPNANGISNLEKSQIFIRNFSANDFLTLGTVDILSQQSTSLNGHDAVRYEIKKKTGVANFTGQPSWRSNQHKLIDVRYAQTNPSIFFVISANPNLNEAVFEQFLQSLIFHNDISSYREPIKDAKSRVTKKPFGLYVTPTTSPIQPDRFTGFHTGTDFEITSDEATTNVTVNALCSGQLLSKAHASGYGGYAVQTCQFNNQRLALVYGHLALNSITAQPNQYLLAGSYLGLLGTQGAETDGARKHLHLSIYTGNGLNIRGYVPNSNQLGEWLDPISLIP